MQFFASFLTLFLSSGYVLFLDHLALSSRALQRSLVLPVVIVLIIIYRSSVRSWGEFLNHWGKLFFLFWGAVLVQMLVLSTGGLRSPFLILIHLFMILLSFIFSFPVAVIFLVLSFAIILIDISFYQSIHVFLMTDPSLVVLQLASLISIIPVAYIISHQYHVKDVWFTLLHERVKTDEAIMERLPELIIITDADLTILSVNDAVERTLQRSRSELLALPLFDVLLLKDSEGKLVTKNTFFREDKLPLKPIEPEKPFLLMASSSTQRHIKLQIQPVKDTGSKISQVSFILSFVSQEEPLKESVAMLLERTRTKYEAIVQDIKRQLQDKNVVGIRSQMLLLEKIENDMYIAGTFNNSKQRNVTKSRFDIAKLCRQVAIAEHDFADAFHTSVTFTIRNFGNTDIAPLTVENYPVKPEQLTGPFFTVFSDVRQMETLIKKLLDRAIFLASGEKEAAVQFTADRATQDLITIKVAGNCPTFRPEQLTDLSLPYYGQLYAITNLHAGSGLEGFLIKTISENLQLPIDVVYKEKPSPHLTVSLLISRNT